MDVSIIIVNYNTKQLLSDCLSSIKEKTFGIEYEVIVVDNDSTDGSQEMLRQDFQWVRLVESGENLGFGKANNLGMSVANGKYFFLLNSDTLLINNAVKHFFDYAESNSDFGALGAILFGSDNKPCHSYGSFITPLRELRFVIAKYLRFVSSSAMTH